MSFLYDIFSDNPKRRDEADRLYKESLALEGKVKDEIDDYNNKINDLNIIAQNNFTLRAIIEVIYLIAEKKSNLANVSKELEGYKTPDWLKVVEGVSIEIPALTGGLLAPIGLAVKFFANRSLSKLLQATNPVTNVEITNLAVTRSIQNVSGAEEVLAMIRNSAPRTGAGGVIGEQTTRTIDRATRISKLQKAVTVGRWLTRVGTGLLVLSLIATVICEYIDGSSEKEQLEKQLVDLRKAKEDLESKRKDLEVMISEVTNQLRDLIERYNIIHKELISFKPIEDEKNKIFTLENISEVIKSQVNLIQQFTTILMKFDEFQTANMAQKTQEQRDQAMEMLVMLGKYTSVEEAKATYELMQKIEKLREKH